MVLPSYLPCTVSVVLVLESSHQAHVGLLIVPCHVVEAEDLDHMGRVETPKNIVIDIFALSGAKSCLDGTVISLYLG